MRLWFYTTSSSQFGEAERVHSLPHQSKESLSYIFHILLLRVETSNSELQSFGKHHFWWVWVIQRPFHLEISRVLASGCCFRSSIFCPHDTYSSRNNLSYTFGKNLSYKTHNLLSLEKAHRISNLCSRCSLEHSSNIWKSFGRNHSSLLVFLWFGTRFLRWNDYENTTDMT